MYKSLFISLFLLFSPISFAAQKPVLPAQATSCIKAVFSNTGNTYWKNISLKVTNQCGQTVDFQNTTINFLNAKGLNTSFWGSFSPLAYPDNNLQITSQQETAGNYLATMYLHFPTSGVNTKLQSGQSFTLNYGASSADYVSGSANVYLGTPVNTASIQLKNTSALPSNTSQPYALVRLAFSGQFLSEVQIPWSNTVKINNLAPGTYTISPTNITSNTGDVWQGTANPATLILGAGANLLSSINYALVSANAGIIFNVQALPTELSGYTQSPVIALQNTNNGSTTNATLAWNASTTLSNLMNGATYHFSTPSISYNGYNCGATFSPTLAVAGATAPKVSLSYACRQVAENNITLNVSGAPSSTASINATFTPNNGTTPISQTIFLTDGAGTATVTLVNGTIYTISSTNINNYTASFNPQPFTAVANATATIKYASNPASTGRIIGYLAGWKTPPAATTLASAGYTHVMVAFGVFNTANPGAITPAFDTISASYIKSLHDAGIKVILSLGGASTSLPNTTIDFHQALTTASTPSAFTQTCISSLEALINQYGFDGFDIDIETGLNAGGTFANPQGDIAVLANIINTMHAKHPALLITLTPQTANIAVTSNFTEIWANYSALIMQTSDSLAWVGIQLYNTGCMLGLDSVCYDANATSSPNFSVAMAADLLENWPAGYQPYVAHLQPSQVVLGYLVANAQGAGDGTPVIPVATIKRAIQCLRTGVKAPNSCDTYVPPHTYPGIGGAFNWEISFDETTGFQFAKGLKACVVNGTC